MKNKIIHLIGKLFPKFRIWYYNKTGQWHWGIIPFIQMTHKNRPDLIKDKVWLSEKGHAWVDEHLDQIFNFKR